MEDVEEEFRKHRQKRRGKRKKGFSGVRRQEKALKRDDVEITSTLRLLFQVKSIESVVFKILRYIYIYKYL